MAATRCAVCHSSPAGLRTGPVPPLSVIIVRGPTSSVAMDERELQDNKAKLDFTARVCSLDCAEAYRVTHPLVDDR